jgi:membrane protein YqaA with SNARE-associated domain
VSTSTTRSDPNAAVLPPLPQRAKDEDSAVHSVPPYSVAPPGEFGRYVRRNFLRAGLAILVLLGFLGVCATWFEHELLALTEGIYKAIGLAGLFAVTFFNDVIISPLPPEAMLMVVAKTGLRSDWLILISIMGLLSAAAGNAAWWIGHSVGARFFPNWIKGVRERHGKTIYRYDRWVVGLSAITPLPFSITCLAAGAVHMRYKIFWPLTLLRVPRFFMFYLMIAHSGKLLSWIF